MNGNQFLNLGIAAAIIGGLWWWDRRRKKAPGMKVISPPAKRISRGLPLSIKRRFAISPTRISIPKSYKGAPSSGKRYALPIIRKRGEGKGFTVKDGVVYKRL